MLTVLILPAFCQFLSMKILRWGSIAFWTISESTLVGFNHQLRPGYCYKTMVHVSITSFIWVNLLQSLTVLRVTSTIKVTNLIGTSTNIELIRQDTEESDVEVDGVNWFLLASDSDWLLPSEKVSSVGRRCAFAFVNSTTFHTHLKRKGA